MKGGENMQLGMINSMLKTDLKSINPSGSVEAKGSLFQGLLNSVNSNSLQNSVINTEEFEKQQQKNELSKLMQILNNEELMPSSVNEMEDIDTKLTEPSNQLFSTLQELIKNYSKESEVDTLTQSMENTDIDTVVNSILQNLEEKIMKVLKNDDTSLSGHENTDMATLFTDLKKLENIANTDEEISSGKEVVETVQIMQQFVQFLINKLNPDSTISNPTFASKMPNLLSGDGLNLYKVHFKTVENTNQNVKASPSSLLHSTEGEATRLQDKGSISLLEESMVQQKIMAVQPNSVPDEKSVPSSISSSSEIEESKGMNLLSNNRMAMDLNQQNMEISNSKNAEPAESVKIVPFVSANSALVQKDENSSTLNNDVPVTKQVDELNEGISKNSYLFNSKNSLDSRKPIDIVNNLNVETTSQNGNLDELANRENSSFIKEDDSQVTKQFVHFNEGNKGNASIFIPKKDALSNNLMSTSNHLDKQFISQNSNLDELGTGWNETQEIVEEQAVLEDNKGAIFNKYFPIDRQSLSIQNSLLQENKGKVITNKLTQEVIIPQLEQSMDDGTNKRQLDGKTKPALKSFISAIMTELNKPISSKGQTLNNVQKVINPLLVGSLVKSEKELTKSVAFSKQEVAKTIETETKTFPSIQHTFMKQEPLVLLTNSGSGQVVRSVNLEQQFEKILSNSQFTKLGDTQTLSIRLAPDHLGSIRIEIIQNDGNMIAKIYTASAEAKEVLDSQLSSLKHGLNAQNLQVDKLDVVLTSQQQDKTNKDPNQQQQEQAPSHREKHQPDEDEEKRKKKFIEELLNIEMEI